MTTAAENYQNFKKDYTISSLSDTDCLDIFLEAVKNLDLDAMKYLSSNQLRKYSAHSYQSDLNYIGAKAFGMLLNQDDYTYFEFLLKEKKFMISESYAFLRFCAHGCVPLLEKFIPSLESNVLIGYSVEGFFKAYNKKQYEILEMLFNREDLLGSVEGQECLFKAACSYKKLEVVELLLFDRKFKVSEDLKEWCSVFLDKENFLNVNKLIEKSDLYIKLNQVLENKSIIKKPGKI